ncbi:butyrophilin-like protein 3 [Danio aesculapii]|uniref:butyrophilin-like protein 3 n=1 Tax=Danio aesculapii TaxID=1142201 RepID=UPI0024C065DA|nr:butyrophilin-like protein 3 [Danio aesculapii]
MKFICLTLMLISGITDSRSDQFAVVGSADPVLAFAGEDVLLPCSVKPNISVVDMRVEWFRLDQEYSVHLYEDHVDRNTEQILSYRGRTELNHQLLQTGNASLRLSAVQVSDEGRYKCFIQSNSGSDDATVNVSVEAVGSPPVITVDGFDRSGGLHLQCESEGWNPEPDLEWLDSEGVRLSPETTETHRNTDGFSVKHTVTVHQRDGKIHCRVRVRHHVLETLISSTSNMFASWRTSVIVISVFSVLSVIAGILIAVTVQKNRAHSKLKKDYHKLHKSNEKLSEEHKQLLKDNKRIHEEHTELQASIDKLQRAHIQLLEDNKSVHKEHKQLQDEKSRIQLELDQLFQGQRLTIPKAITHLRQHRVNVTLDADSAHPHLIVSEDGKQMTCGNTQMKEVNRENDTFTEYLGVLGKEGFSSGCFYFEVKVKGQIKWDLGVTRESADRQELCSLSPKNGYWTVGLIDKKYWAHESSYVFIPLSVKPQRVGVFVDYEKGFVSFYDVESMFHIYSYTGQSFNGKLCPFGCLGYYRNGNSTPLRICDDY